MDEQKIIAENIAAIEALDPKLYPELSKILFEDKRSTLHAHLLFIWEFMKARPVPPEEDQYGCGYWPIPVSRLKKEHGGKSESWNSHIVLLTDIGLLRRIKPDKNTKHKGLRKAYIDAKKQKHRAPSYFRVFKYTPEIFAKADEKARQYNEKGFACGRISKTDMIRVSGEQRAYEVFRDGRTIGAAEEFVWGQLKQAILQRIREKGYTTPDEIAGDVAKILPDPEHRKALKKSMNRKAAICKEAGCRYGAPKKEQRTAYQLEDQRWIITKIKEPPH